MVVVSSGDLTRQLTVHRPLGFHNLEDDDWVVSTPAGANLLKGRVEHPDASKYALQARKNLLAAYIAACPLGYKLTGDTTKLAWHNHDRNVLVSAAKKLSRAHWRSLNPVVERKQGEKKPPAPKPEPDSYYVEFLADPDAANLHPAPREAKGEVKDEKSTIEWTIKSVGGDPAAYGALTSGTQRRKYLLSLGLDRNGNKTPAATASGVRTNTDLQSAESAYLSFVKDKQNVSTARAKVAVEPYETKGGIPPTESQTACPRLKGKNRAAAIDKLTELLVIALRE